MKEKESEQGESGWSGLLRIFSEAEDTERTEELLNLFFTLSEKEALVQRYNLVKALLEEKRTQREISQELGISISKITAGSKALKVISGKMKAYLTTKMRIH